MSAWPTVALDSLCEINVGRTPSRYESAYWEDGIYPWVSISDMSRSKRIAVTKESFSEKARTECNMKPVQPGTVLLSFKLSIGKVSIADRKLYTNEAIAALPVLDSKRLDPIYLAHALEAVDFSGTGNRAVMGATLNKAALKKLRIPLPPLDEQKRIAAILDQADELRRKRQHAIDRLNQLGQAIFHEMFGATADSPDKAIELSGLLTFVTSGGRGWSKYYAEAGTRFIRSFDVQMNTISSDDIAFVDAPNNAEARRTAIQTGDVLLTITGSKIGRVAPIPADFGPAFVSQHVAILRADQSRILPEFLSYYLSLPNGGQLQIAKNQYGQTKPGLNFDQIGRFLVPDVSISQQRAFVDAVAQVDDISSKADAAFMRDETLFQSLQHRAFQGEL